MSDLGIIGLEKQAEYEKQLINESIDINRFELDKEKVNGKESDDIPTILIKLKRKGIKGLNDDEIRILEVFLNENNN